MPVNRLTLIKLQGGRIVAPPFDWASVTTVVKAVNDSRLSADALNPTTVSVSVPHEGVEQREEIVRRIKRLGEEARIGVRGIRQDARKQVESGGRGSLRFVQEATDAPIEDIEQLA